MIGLATTSSTFSYQWVYDVFINFRGEDTRSGFTGTLYYFLSESGVHTFLDDEELRSGDEINPSLFKAIENSRMAITVFSKNYASSTFCLDELVKIHECIKRKGRVVLPIFYDVEPSEVRHQKGNYEQALSMHVKNLRADGDRIQRWKLALHEVSNISGFHFTPGQGYEYQFIGRIVKEISSKMNRVPLHVAPYPVGLESRVLAINSLLQIGSTDKVIMVGICGIGGIGKTTIARAVYNSVADNFEGMCFYHDVKEDSGKLGLEQIQETILLKIVGGNIKIQDVNEGVEVIKMRLKQKKILLILDNITNHEQLKILAGDCNWFSDGSRIIITTRDRHLLVRHGVESIYNMEAFSGKESLELLSWNTFRNNNVNPSYMEMLNRAVIYAQGLPLALEVIGSNFCGRTIYECESMLDGYKLIPNKDIQQVLKLSYEGLEQVEREIFLDIACFFKGKYLEDVKYIEEVVHGFNDVSYFIGVLADKCLIKIENCYIEMHDLIQDMGREVVREESPNKPGKRSRLWFHQDIVDVLEDNTGTDEVRMMIQDNLSKCIDVNWDGEAFKSMKQLKILIFESVKFSEIPKYLPNSLRVLKWKEYPYSCLPPNFFPKKLVVLNIGNGYLSSLETIKTSYNLGVLNLQGCEYVTAIPNLSNMRNLKELDLQDCKNLIEIHDSIGYLEKLEILNVEGCARLETFPGKIKLPSLRRLCLSYCSSLKYFPEILEEVKIRVLSLVGTGIEELPRSICNLSQLIELFIGQNKRVIEIPDGIFLLPGLEEIRVVSHGKVMSSNSKEAQDQAIWSKQCPNRVKLHLPGCHISDYLLRTYLRRFINVKHLDLTGNNFTILPAWIKECHFLRDLKLNECKHLREVEGIPLYIRILEAMNCVSLSLESKRLLLSEELHGAPGRLSSNSFFLRQMHFCVPTTSIPHWFDHRSKGASISFWYRNYLEALCLCVLLKPTNGVFESNRSYLNISVLVYVNGNPSHCRDLWSWNALNVYHLVVYNLKSCDITGYPGPTRVNEWNHVQVHASPYPDDALVIEESGIYVVKQVRMMEHVTFQNPYERLGFCFTSGDQGEQLGTRMKDKGELHKKGKLLMWGDDFALSPPALRCTKRGRNISINQDDNDAITPRIINNQEASLMDLELNNTTSLPMLPWTEQAAFRNQGHSIEDDKWLSLRPCWETPFCEESANHQEFQRHENITSTYVEQVQKSFEDKSKAKGKETVEDNDNINE